MNNRIYSAQRFYLSLAVLFTLAILSFVEAKAQVSPAAKAKDAREVVEVVTLKLNSKLMGREMPYRILYPKNYKEKSEAERRYPVIYLLHGLTGHYTNWTDRTRLAEYASDHQFLIVTPEGDNGWYSDSVSVANDKYESYIAKELIPEIDKAFRTIADRDHRIIAGLSMGGYGSLKFGLKYPEMFSLVGSFSGALSAASYSAKNAATAGRGVDLIFGAEGNDTRKANDIYLLAESLSPQSVKSLPYIYQSCGTEDFLIQDNRKFLALMNEKKIAHEYREHPGVHDWVFWNDQIREFLNVAERRLKK